MTVTIKVTDISITLKLFHLDVHNLKLNKINDPLKCTILIESFCITYSSLVEQNFYYSVVQSKVEFHRRLLLNEIKLY